MFSSRPLREMLVTELPERRLNEHAIWYILWAISSAVIVGVPRYERYVNARFRAGSFSVPVLNL